MATGDLQQLLATRVDDRKKFVSRSVTDMVALRLDIGALSLPNATTHDVAGECCPGDDGKDRLPLNN